MRNDRFLYDIPNFVSFLGQIWESGAAPGWDVGCQSEKQQTRWKLNLIDKLSFSSAGLHAQHRSCIYFAYIIKNAYKAKTRRAARLLSFHRNMTVGNIYGPRNIQQRQRKCFSMHQRKKTDAGSTAVANNSSPGMVKTSRPSNSTAAIFHNLLRERKS